MPPYAYRCLVALSLLALAGTVAAAVTYRWVDAQGVVHYSDTPHPGAEQIQLSGAQTYHGPPASTAPAAPPPPAAQAAGGYQSCAITQPSPDVDLFAPEAVNISVRTSPALRAGDQLAVSVDGTALQPVGDGTTFQLVAPDRGTHSVSAEVRSADGTVLCNAPGISFSVQRPSVNAPLSPVKPH
jgi:Domain of unknown function (DUF4124)